MPDPVSLMGRVLAVLPPAMIVLVLLNIGVLWMVQSNMEARNAMITRILDACVERKP